MKNEEIEIYAHYEFGKCVWMKIDGIIYERGTPEFEKYKFK